MYVLVKDLSTSKVNIVKSRELHKVNNDSYQYSPFTPESDTDFDKKQYYGTIRDNNIVLHYILAMSDSKHTIEKFRDNQRENKIRNPTRLSTSDAVLSLEKFKLVAERIKCKDSKIKKQSSEKSREKQTEKKIAEKFRMKSCFVTDAQPQGAAMVKCITSENTAHKAVDPEPDHVPETHKSGSIDGKNRPPLFTVDPCESCQSLKKAVRDLTEENKDLKEKLDFCMEHKEAIEKENTDLNAHINKIQQQLESAVQKISVLEIEKKGLVQGVGSEIKKAVEEELKSLKVPLTENCCKLQKLTNTKDGGKTEDGMAYVECSHNISVLKTDIAEVEFKSPRLSSRVLGLCELFWPKKVHLMRLSQDKDSDGTVINESNILDMLVILNSMDWKEEDVKYAYDNLFKRNKQKVDLSKLDYKKPITVSLLKYQLRRTTYDARVKFRNTNMTAAEWKQQQEKKLNRKRENSGKNVPKKKKKKVVLSSSSSSDSDSEETTKLRRAAEARRRKRGGPSSSSEDEGMKRKENAVKLESQSHSSNSEEDNSEAKAAPGSSQDKSDSEIEFVFQGLESVSVQLNE